MYGFVLLLFLINYRKGSNFLGGFVGVVKVAGGRFKVELRCADQIMERKIGHYPNKTIYT